MHRGKDEVNQYSEIILSIVSKGMSSVSDHSSCFSPIQARRASGLEDKTRPMVEGRVACSKA